ncbi:MAG: HAMP domain-containing histidine kinase [Bauldia sp.]|nr:HAMP domain-containing histidine kinase [Bauldia sp.]
MARGGRIVSTTAFKLSAIYLAVFTVFALVFVLSINFAANRLFNQQISATIASEFSDLAIAWNEGGVVGLINAIDGRSNRPGASLYLLADSNGGIVAGNVNAVATEFLARAVQTPAVVGYTGDDGVQRVAMVQVVRLSGGLFLLVGRDMSERERFAEITRLALIVAGVLLLGLGLVSWFFVSRRVLRRIDSISATTRRIMAGDLTGRLEVAGTKDEFDRLADSLNAMLERLEALMRGLKEVSDNIAHDLKTPLSRMRNRLDAALASADREAGREAMAAAIEDADQLIETFNALLTIARIEAGSTDEHADEVDAAAMVRDIVELYEPVADEAGAAIVVQAEGTQPLRGNRELLSQAVANLIDNAIKHGRPADPSTPPSIRVSVRRDGNDLLIAVADNGPGIPEEERGRVQERFVRLETSRSTPGTGLGLSLVAALAKLHRGRLELTDVGPGLLATIRLPVAVA